MTRSIATVTLVVDDYQRAIDYFCGVLGFHLFANDDLGDDKRWVVVGPDANGHGARLLLARAVGLQQEAALGNQAGGRVAFFLETDDFDRDHASMTSKGVRFIEAPRNESYGRVAVFEDLYGNRWDLIGPA